MEGFHEILVPQKNIPAIVMLHSPEEIPCQSHWHEGIELVASLNSRLRIRCGQDEYCIGENDIALFNHAQIHKVTPVEGYAYSAISIRINPGFFENYCNDEYIWFELKQNRKATEDIIIQCTKLYELYSGKADEQALLLKANSILFHIAYLLVTQLKSTKPKSNSKGSKKYFERYRKIISYMEEHYQEPLTLKELADNVHISREHLSHEFETYVGRGFREHLANIRLVNAQRDLLYSDLPLIDVAIHNGFSDLRSYNRAFQKYYDMTPLQYRRKFQRESNI